MTVDLQKAEDTGEARGRLARTEKEVSPPRKRGDGKERILLAALDQFAAVGFDGASTPEIARAANVSQSVVMYHFSTKEELWQAAMTRLFQNLGLASSVDAVAFRSMPARERFGIFLREFVRITVTHPHLGKIIFRESLNGGPRLKWLIEQQAMPQYRTLFRLIEELKAEGAIGDFDPVMVALAIHGAGATLFNVSNLSSMLMQRDPFDQDIVEQQVDLLVTIFHNGLIQRQT